MKRCGARTARLRDQVGRGDHNAQEGARARRLVVHHRLPLHQLHAQAEAALPAAARVARRQLALSAGFWTLTSGLMSVSVTLSAPRAHAQHLWLLMSMSETRFLLHIRLFQQTGQARMKHLEQTLL